MRGRAFIAGVSLGLIVARGPACGAGHKVDFREMEKVVAAELKETNTPGAARAIVSGDRIVYEKGFGVSDIETGTPALRGTSRAECERAMVQGAVCEAANKRVIELMNVRGLEAATAVMDVQTGALVTFASTPESNANPTGVEPLTVTTPILPLSLTKLFLAAAWWDRGLPESSFDCIRSAAPEKTEPMTIPEMIVIGCDLPAKQNGDRSAKESRSGRSAGRFGTLWIWPTSKIVTE
jgi:hypothetical protein